MDLGEPLRVLRGEVHRRRGVQAMTPGKASAFDVLIVGAGLAGLVLAERLCTQLGWRCVVVDRRGHVGGNCYDEADENGVLTHRYGPHYFRTNSPAVLRYLSRFTEWTEAHYVVKSFTDGRFWSFPINLSTFEELLGRRSTPEEFRSWLDSRRLHIPFPKNSAEVVLAQVGRELYRKFFEGYTRKQWRKDPRELHPSVCGRLPVRITRDQRYGDEQFQVLPKDGYTAMFQRLIACCGDRLTVLLGTDYREIAHAIRVAHLVYTGPIDEYFAHCYGPLEYRSLRFERRSFHAEELEREGKSGFWQPYLQVNYPNSEEFTRIVEIKHATGQQTPHTAIVREYPADYGEGQEPYYPVPTATNGELYHRYAALAARQENVTFIGRLARYRYYNMDQVVALALHTFEAKFARHHRQMTRESGATVQPVDTASSPLSLAVR